MHLVACCLLRSGPLPFAAQWLAAHDADVVPVAAVAWALALTKKAAVASALALTLCFGGVAQSYPRQKWHAFQALSQNEHSAVRCPSAQISFGSRSFA